MCEKHIHFRDEKRLIGLYDIVLKLQHRMALRLFCYNALVKSKEYIIELYHHYIIEKINKNIKV